MHCKFFKVHDIPYITVHFTENCSLHNVEHGGYIHILFRLLQNLVNLIKVCFKCLQLKEHKFHLPLIVRTAYSQKDVRQRHPTIGHLCVTLQVQTIYMIVSMW